MRRPWLVVAGVGLGFVSLVGCDTRADRRATTIPATEERPAAVGALALRPADVTATDLTRYRVVIMNAWEWRRAAALKKANADTTVLVYKDMASTRDYAVETDGKAIEDDALLPTGVGYAAALRDHRDWFLLDDDGERIEWAGYDGHWWMDVGDESYADAWLSSVRDEVEQRGWDGVMIDNAIVDPAVYLEDGARLREYPTAESYQVATERFLQRVAPALRSAGAEVVVNLGGAVPELELYERWATIGGGVMREHFGRGGSDGAGDVAVGDEWLRQLEQQETAAKSGIRYLAVSYAAPSDREFLDYARASFLVGWDGKDTSALLVAAPDAETDPWSDAWTVDVGRPVGDRREVGGAWVRRFSEGVVAVNPTSRAVPVEVPEPVVLPPRSGLVVRAP